MNILSFRSLIYRIKWKSLIALALLIGTVYVVLNSIPTGYQVGGDIGLWAEVRPDVIGSSDIATVEVELKNMKEKDSILVLVKCTTHDENLLFDDTYAQTYQSKPITIGPQEIRKIDFKIRSRPSILPGEYRVNVIAEEVGNEEKGRAERSVPITVEIKNIAD